MRDKDRLDGLHRELSELQQELHDYWHDVCIPAGCTPPFYRRAEAIQKRINDVQLVIDGLKR